MEIIIILLKTWLKITNTSDVILENIALRQQLSVLKASSKKTKLRNRDRFFWIIISKIWSNWRKGLIIVQPDTVVRWHRKGFKLFWAWKCRKKGPGRPKIAIEIRELIKNIANANPTWGAPRIHGELLKLGIKIDQTTVSNYLKRFRTGKPPSQTWRTFLKNHIGKCGIDFFTVPTGPFRILYVLIVIKHHRREIIHFNVTEHPTSAWTAQQIVEAFP